MKNIKKPKALKKTLLKKHVKKDMGEFKAQLKDDKKLLKKLKGAK